MVHVKTYKCFNLVEGGALKLMSDMARAENLQVIKLLQGGKYIVRSSLECGSEVPSSSGSCSKARSCRACLGFP